MVTAAAMSETPSTSSAAVAELLPLLVHGVRELLELGLHLVSRLRVGGPETPQLVDELLSRCVCLIRGVPDGVGAEG